MGEIGAGAPEEGGGKRGGGGGDTVDRFGDGVAGDATAFGGEEGVGGDGGGGEAEIGGGRQLVEIGEAPHAGLAAAEEEGAVALAPSAGHGLFFDDFGGEAGESLGLATGAGGAVGAHGADAAAGRAAMADSGAEFHNGLIVIAGARGAEKGIGERGEGGGRVRAVAVGGGIGRDAGEQADDVAIDDGGGGVESDARDGGGGVGADAGEGLPLVAGAGEGRKGDEVLGEAVEVAGAGVVAEAFPLFHDGGLGGGGEGGEVGEDGEPAREVGQHGFHLSLLEHELAHHGTVEGGRAAPGKIAGVGVIPSEQVAAKRGLPVM